MENRFYHLPGKALISLKQKVKAHNLFCLDQAAASKLVSWPSVPLTHIHPFTSWAWACHGYAQGLSMVPHHTDKMTSLSPTSGVPTTRTSLTHPPTKRHGTSVLVHALAWKTLPPLSPSSTPSPNATSPRWRKGKIKVKGEPLNVKTEEDHEKYLVNDNSHCWYPPTMYKTLCIHFCIEPSNNPEPSF